MFAKKALAASVSAAPKTYVEDVFSTYLYTGNSSTQTITNNIDLSGEGGLVWIKSRKQTDGSTSPIGEHGLWDTARGAGTSATANKTLASNSTDAEGRGWTDADYVSAFTSSGFTVANGAGTTTHRTANHLFQNYASWTFRKAKKFFDVVTYTGTGSARTVSHNLGSVPGCIMVKRTDTSADWQVFHRIVNRNRYLVLNSTAAQATGTDRWDSTDPTSTVFSLGTSSDVNASGGTYVAYLFAHNAGGFGDAGSDSVISCGSYTGNGSFTGPTITLGWEPQWVLIKQSTQSGTRWTVTDNMRGFPASSSGQNILQPHVSDAEVGVAYIQPTSTGFKVVDTDADVNSSGETYIYIAIRRGPMKTPTSGTSVFTPVVRTGTNGTTSYTGLSFSPDLVIGKARANTYSPAPTYTTKLTGTNAQLGSSSTNGESTASDAITGWLNTGYNLGADNSLGNYNLSTTSNNYVTWNFGRAPGFFDVVCYTGTGATRTVSHNLAAVPELLIVKRRDTVEDWNVYSATTGNAAYLRLNTTAAVGTAGADAFWGSTTPTSSVFTVKTSGGTNASGGTYVAYLFASVAGVSKVGSYTGTGTTLQINCGFTSGARFVMIKRTDDAYPWYVWDSARGIVSGNDPYIRINQTSAEVTDQDDIDPYSSGFELSSAALGINASGGTYIYLAIA